MTEEQLPEGHLLTIPEAAEGPVHLNTGRAARILGYTG